MAHALVNARVLLPDGFRDGVAVVIEGGRIAAIGGDVPAGAERIDLAGRMLLPGFIDTQVNGGGGILFNDAPTVETVARIAAAHRRFGTTGLLPTLISDSLEAIAAAIRAVDEAIAAGVPGVIGIHIEGPFISLARIGIHDAAHVRVLDEDAIALLCSARRGRTLVTLAPEAAPPGAIAKLVAGGVTVAAGHTEADHDTMRRAFDEGMSGVTHLFNAMSPMTSRAPGAVGAALDDRDSFAGLIVDGHHVHPATMRVAIRAKGADRTMLVTDAMSLAGVEDDRFALQGREIRREGDRLVDAAGTLAGSTLTMKVAVRNAVAMTGVDVATAVAMASAVPAAFLGLSARTGRIAPGLAADLIAVDDEFEVARSWIGGREAAG